MFSLGKKKAALRALGRRVPLKALPNVQPILLLQMVIGLSQTLNGAVAQPEAVARALITDGQQRLRALRRAAPNLDLSLSRLLRKICSSEMSEDDLSDEESAVQAMLEVCLGLMLHWLSKKKDRPYADAPSTGGKRVLLADASSMPHPSLYLLFRARSCLIS